jgi:hypothetical protein
VLRAIGARALVLFPLLFASPIRTKHGVWATRDRLLRGASALLATFSRILTAAIFPSLTKPPVYIRLPADSPAILAVVMLVVLASAFRQVPILK